MGESLWDEREQKILEAVAEAERDPGPPDIEYLTRVTDLDPLEVERATKALYRASPGFIDGAAEIMGGGRFVMANVTLTERGRRAAGQWPSENHFERLIEVLDRTVSHEADDEKARRLRGVKDAAVSDGSGVMTAVLSEYLKRSVGLT